MDELLVTSCPQLADADRRLLIQLADGSIGRALEIVAAGGLDLYRDIVGQLRQLPKFDAIALHALGDRLGHKDASDLFCLATEILITWLSRTVRLAATGQGPATVIDGDVAPFGRHSLEQWLELWEKIARLFARVDSANLDRKQVWVGAMLDIAGLASR
jgi:DNA polymerase-3 subunit delta'